MLRALLSIAIVVLVGVIAVIAIGAALPVRHRATRSAVFAVAPTALRAMITEVAAYPAWRHGVRRVEGVRRDGDTVRYQEVSSDGAIDYAMNVGDSDRLTSTIVGGVTAFGGTWTYQLAPAPRGTILEITEDGEVYNPVFRFMSRFVFGHTATIDRYLRDLETRTEGITPAR